MAITPKSEDKYVEKCSTAQSFIRTEMSTYWIGTLEALTIFLLVYVPQEQSDFDMEYMKVELVGHIVFKKLPKYIQ